MLKMCRGHSDLVVKVIDSLIISTTVKVLKFAVFLFFLLFSRSVRNSEKLSTNMNLCKIGKHTKKTRISKDQKIFVF